MATATKQDDDLLIIADDTSSDSAWDIEFSFDFWEDISADTKEPSTPEQTPDPVVSDSSSKITDEKNSQDLPTQETPEAPSAPAVNSETDLGISFDTGENKVADTPVIEDSNSSKEPTASEAPAEEFSFDLGWESEDSASIADKSPENSASESASNTETLMDVAEPKETETLWESSMNDILSATIAKLVARQEVIATSKAWKATKEEDIKKQITELQSQVAELEADMKSLDNESDKITANIKELENMKLDPVKEHNSKRVTKK